MRLSLSAKILLCFFLNVLVLALAFVLLLNFNQQLPAISRAFNESSNAVRAVARLITAEMREKSKPEREEILQRYTAAYQIDFLLYTNQGEKVVGKELPLPTMVLEYITSPPSLPRVPEGRNEDRQPPPALDVLSTKGRPPFPLRKLQTDNPRRYWAVIRIPLYEKGQEEPIHASLVAVSDSRSGNGLFFDPVPWIFVGLAMIALSILLWVPLIRSLTKAIQQMTNATQQIAAEQFDVLVDEQRSDEIGHLGKAINHLATRLSSFVYGQKRFLGDISHELNSPLARMQFALSLLEDDVGSEHHASFAEVQEEVQLMSQLVSELLVYSKAGMKTTEIRLELVRLRPLVKQVLTREAAETDAVKIEIDDTLEVLANPELLTRALANVIRNAVRYAGTAGAIQIVASRHGQRVTLCVADNGPGVPDAALHRLFDPFYRLEADRDRTTGGAGLGLAIVKSCVESCQGTVTAKNRQPAGLEIVLNLRA